MAKRTATSRKRARSAPGKPRASDAEADASFANFYRAVVEQGTQIHKLSQTVEKLERTMLLVRQVLGRHTP